MLPRALQILLGVLSVCLLAACGDGGQPPQARPNIILISIDSLRADHVGCYGYARPTTPTIDRLAREGVMFRTAVSTTSWTLPAHAALFTGLYDSAHGTTDVTARLDERHVTLAEALRGNGYQTVGLFGGPFLHPTFGLGQGFESYLNCMTVLSENAPDETFRTYASHAASHDDITGPRTVERFAAWLSAMGAHDGRPIFAFVHLWDVHFDYMPPRKYVQMFDPDYTGDVSARQYMHNEAVHAGMAARDLEHVIALYDGELRFTDDIIAQLLDVLDKAGRLDNTIVVITADHGEEFFEHGGKGHQRTLYDEVVRVPLVMWQPGKLPAGRVVDEQVRLIDIAPTLLAAGGVAAQPRMQGRDLSGLINGMTPGAGEPALLELLAFNEQLRGVRTNDYKLLRDDVRELVGFFDLRADPGEQVSQSGDGRAPAAAEQLRELVAESEAQRLSGDGDANDAVMDDAMRSRLESLGYTGD